MWPSTVIQLQSKDWVEVGAARSATLSGLDLRHGDTYAVAVQAISFTGKRSNIQDDIVTIDVTPPESSSRSALPGELFACLWSQDASC